MSSIAIITQRVLVAACVTFLPLSGPSPLPNTLLAMPPDFDFESSDILGGALPVGRGRVAQHSSFSSFFKLCVLGACTLLLLLAFRHGRTFFLRWKERHYKLYLYLIPLFCVSPKLAFIRSMRRRYGIPDHDQRPFNVAYAAARLAQEDKRKIQDRMRNLPISDPPNAVGHRQTRIGMLSSP